MQFEYADEWLRDPQRFAMEPGLPLTRGGFQPPAGQIIHGALGDSAPDTLIAASWIDPENCPF